MASPGAQVEASLPVVEQWRVRAVCVPLEEPHRTASGVITESPLVLTDVVIEGGVVGHSLLFTYTRAALGPTADLVRNLGALVQGERLAPAGLENRLAGRFKLLGTQGLVGMALAALDMALWDALARLHGCSLCALLGFSAKPVRAYGAIGYEGVQGSAAAAERWLKRGFTGVKAKIGYPTAAEDLAVVRAIRKAVGDRVAVMVDYNQSLSPSEAVERLRSLDEEGLTWIEEPTLAHDYAGHAHIARETRTPIQCGENWWGTLDLRHALDAQASDFVMLEAMKIGGVTGWMRGAALAHSRAVPVSSHLWPEISAQLLSCTPTAHWLEYCDWWNPVLSEPLRIERGLTQIDGVLGTGVTWNEGAVPSFSV
jgi:mandelate racemase